MKNGPAPYAHAEEIPPDIREKMQHIVREEGFVKSAHILGVAPMTLQKILRGSRVRTSTIDIVGEGFNKYYRVEARRDDKCPLCLEPKQGDVVYIEEINLETCPDCALVRDAVESFCTTEPKRREIRRLLGKYTPAFGL